MAKLSDVGERAAIQILANIFDRGHPIGLGHDCGVVDWGEDFLVITTDVVNPRTHIPAGATPQQVGWYVTAVNLSDIAAAGARALGFVAALSLPPDTETEFLKGLGQGMEECAREFGVAVLGGDTKESDVMSLAGTAIGRVPKNRILLRTGARPGDAIVVTGDLGRAGLAFQQLSNATVRALALQSLMRPYPRLYEGREFSESGAVTSCMDISDGLGASLAQMAGMTGLSYVVEWEKVPVYRDAAGLALPLRKDLALYSGGDYELVATVKPEAVETLEAELKSPNRQHRSALTVIGHVEKGAGGNVLVAREGREPLLAKGWEHFRPSHAG
ncbi:MAG TPA: thiamine-phosphate kinase [Thermoplasmata archaeon]|nr:thiamine-phosphate kinase [Thermoplasmata archaeon]